MKTCIGIRHEDKYLMEKRVALTPEHLGLLSGQGIDFEVQKSDKRAFTDAEYKEAGAKIVDHFSEAQTIFGVKEIPEDFFETGKTYVFFSHVIKGQPYNMPMLKAMMRKKCQLIDYEKIVNEEGKRLIFFGRFAGLAGMINSLWSYGKRLKLEGVSNPFENIRQAHTYSSLSEAMKAVSEAGYALASKGMNKKAGPMIIGFTGYGNVSKGAQEIANLLPSIEISPRQLLELDFDEAPSNIAYKVIFKEKDISTPIDEKLVFKLSHYYKHPELYKNNFEQYIPKLSILMNCMYWDDRYPRIVTKDYLGKLFKTGKPHLKVIGDVSCDPDGSIEITHKGTEIEDPVFVYNPIQDDYTMGFEGEGVLVMAVDILPSELPRESSEAFSEVLYPFVKAIANQDFGLKFDQLSLPLPIKKALILHQGELTPDFKYIERHL